MCVCCPSNLSMNSPAGVFPNRARPASDRNERRSDRAERKQGGWGGGRKVEIYAKQRRCLGIKEHACGLKSRGWETIKQLPVRASEQVRC